MTVSFYKIGVVIAAASCALVCCSQPSAIPVQDFPAEDVKYAGETGRVVKEVPGVYEFHWGRVEYNNFKTLLYEEGEKDKTTYRDFPDLLQKKKEQGAEVDSLTLSQMEKHLNAAVGWLKAAIEKNPKYGLAFLVLGLSYYQLQKYEDAVSALRKVVEIHPKAANTYITMALCYQNMGKKKEALDCANQALKIEPDNIEAQLLIDNLSESIKQ